MSSAELTQGLDDMAGPSFIQTARLLRKMDDEAISAALVDARAYQRSLFKQGGWNNISAIAGGVEPGDVFLVFSPCHRIMEAGKEFYVSNYIAKGVVISRLYKGQVTWRERQSGTSAWDDRSLDVYSNSSGEKFDHRRIAFLVKYIGRIAIEDLP